MENQRLKTRIPQPAKERLIPRLIALRHNTKTHMVRRTNGRMQIEMPAIRTRRGKKLAHAVFKHECPRGLVTLRKLRPASAKHPVDIAFQIALVLRQRRRIPQHHQHAAAQRKVTVKKCLQQ
ncbi:hypothetical protein D3C80_1389980 [compost metagenome]